LRVGGVGYDKAGGQVADFHGKDLGQAPVKALDAGDVDCGQGLVLNSAIVDLQNQAFGLESKIWIRAHKPY
jgi:hypothetical protein